MTDINKEVSDLLSDTCTVELSFPSIASAFPYVSLTEINNSSAAIVDNAERYSNYECQIDVWDTKKNGNTARRCTQLANAISDVMITAGFSRSDGKLMQDGESLHRYMMTFSCKFDNKHQTAHRA